MGGMNDWTKPARRPGATALATIGAGAVLPRQPAPARDEPVAVWPHLVLAEEAVGYVSRDARLREAIYRATCGIGEAWPIPLTYCAEPAQVYVTASITSPA